MRSRRSMPRRPRVHGGELLGQPGPLVLALDVGASRPADGLGSRAIVDHRRDGGGERVVVGRDHARALRAVA